MSAFTSASSNIGQATRAIENATKAFALRERVSERERNRISASYYTNGTGELDKANQSYEMWKQSYPRDPLPHGNLGEHYMKLGQWEMALLETEESLRLEGNSYAVEGNLAWIQLALGRTEDARRTVGAGAHTETGRTPSSQQFLSDGLPSW